MMATLALRRTAPVAMAALTACISLSHLLAEGSFAWPGDVMLLVAAYSVAAYARGQRRVVGSLLGVVFLAVFAARAIDSEMASTQIDVLLMIGIVFVSFVAAWAFGLLHRHHVDALHQAEYRRILSERDADARSRLAAHEERERIGDEMHDVLAHTLAGITIQTESGQVVASSEEVRDLFARISDASRSALLEVRDLLAPTDSAEAIPLPTLEDIDNLLNGFRASGLGIDYQERGARGPLSLGLSQAVYRVVQESLTNAVRHGAESRATVIADWNGEQLTITVSNPVDADYAETPILEHRGIAGMRRRCTLYGGDLHYVAQRNTFTVVATWPLATAGTSAMSP